jgi:hypothetical protein
MQNTETIIACADTPRGTESSRSAVCWGAVFADAARKAAAAFSLWAFASLLVGAFVASLAATIGGRARDR